MVFISDAPNGKVKFSLNSLDAFDLWRVIRPDLEPYLTHLPLNQLLVFAYMLGAYHTISLQEEKR